jgi:hypothetical protein
MPNPYLGAFFDYTSLVLNAALRMELGLIALGFPHMEMTVRIDQRLVFFRSNVPREKLQNWMRRREFGATVEQRDLDTALGAEQALDQAVRRVLDDAARANAAAYRRVNALNDWRN